jgi:hypothetical protein
LDVGEILGLETVERKKERGGHRVDRLGFKK